MPPGGIVGIGLEFILPRKCEAGQACCKNIGNYKQLVPTVLEFLISSFI